MALSFGKNKNKSSSSQTQQFNQTETDSLTAGSRQLLMDRLGEIRGETYQRLDPGAYEAYLSPYQDEVIGAATADIEAARARAATDQRAATLARGAKGLSDRRGVYEAELNAGYDRNLASTVANLRNQGYAQALGVAQGENANENAFAAQMQARIDALIAQMLERTRTSSGTSSGTSKGKSTGYSFGWTGGGS